MSEVRIAVLENRVDALERDHRRLWDRLDNHDADMKFDKRTLDVMTNQIAAEVAAQIRPKLSSRSLSNVLTTRDFWIAMGAAQLAAAGVLGLLRLLKVI